MSLAAKSPTLSVTIITLNEEDRIERLLRSVSFADEIVVVDSGSSDRTTEICKKHGVRLYHHDFEGYADQKQFAMGVATSEWILSLDADEMITDEGRKEILESLANADSTIVGFSFPRLSRYLNRWIRHGGWFPDRKVRLIKTGMGHWSGDSLHEKLEVNGSVLNLSHPILHFVYRDISDQIKTIDRFSSTFASSAQACRFPRSCILWGIFHAIGKFLECAVWKLGFLDGIPGIIIAINSSFYIFLKHAKRWEEALAKSPANHSLK